MALRTRIPALLLGAAAAVAVGAPPAPARAQDGGSRFPFLRELQDLPLPIPGLRPGTGAAAPPPPGAPAGNQPPIPPDPAPAGALAVEGAPPAPLPGPGGAPAPEAAGMPPPADAGQPAEAAAAGPGPSDAVSSYSLRAFRLGVLAGRDVHGTMAALQPVADGLQGALGRSVDILPMPSYRAMIDAQAMQRIDGGIYSAEAYSMAEAQCRCLEPLVAPTAADGSAAYYAIIVAAPESGIASVADLAGKTVAMGPRDSVGARRMQIGALAGEGFDVAASVDSLVETESPGEAVRLVADGEADAAFAWSSLEGELQAGYSRGTLADLVASGDIAMGEVAVIWRSPAIAHGPVAVAAAMPEDDKRRIEGYLIGLSAAAPEAYDVLNPFYPGGYVAVEPDDYRGLDALAGLDGDAIEPSMPPPAVAPGPTPERGAPAE